MLRAPDSPQLNSQQASNQTVKADSTNQTNPSQEQPNNNSVLNNVNSNNADNIVFSSPVPPLSSMSSTGTSTLHARRESDAMSLEDGQTDRHRQNSTEKRRYNLSDFQILNTLGTGSFGRVHLVQDLSKKEYRALKVMKKSEVVRLKQVEHTINEKTILEQLRHPFLVHLFGVFQDSQNLYLVLEYVQGGELFTYLRKSGVSNDAPIVRFCCNSATQCNCSTIAKWTI